MFSKSTKTKGDKTTDKPAAKKKKSKKTYVPVSITDSIPYVAVYENGIIEVRPGFFSSSYIIPPVNFKTATDSAQYQLAELYYEFMNTFEGGVDVEITLFNMTTDMDDFRERVFIKMQADNYNNYRAEYNDTLEQKIKSAKNNLETVKILTVTVPAIDIAAAADKLDQVDTMVSENMTTMTKQATVPLTINERLSILNQIYNIDDACPVYEKKNINGYLSESYTLENLAAQGITTKELIAPETMEFKSNIAKIGNYYVKTFYVNTYPTYIRGTILTDFAKIPTNMLASVHFLPMDQADGIKLVREKSVNIKSEVIDAQKKGARQNIYGDIAVPIKLNNANEEVDELVNSVTKDNAKIFRVTFVFALFARTEKEMESYEEQLKLIGNKNMISIHALSMQHEAGFNTALPLGNNCLRLNRLMPTQSIASIIPFDVREVNQREGAMYYGLNAVSHNLIIYNRTSDMNPNSCILGMPGSGKSFAAKREMINVLLNTDDYVYVIDPEREYRALGEAFGATIVEISSNSTTYINPFDINLENADDNGDPVKVKTDFIEALCTIMVGGKYGLTPIEETIIERAVTAVYEEHIIYLRRMGLSQDKAKAPTIHEFYNNLCNQRRMEAQNLALSLERYVKGSLDIFSHHTNVDTNSRFVIYDIKDIGVGLKKLGLQISLDNIFNKMIANKAQGKKTWFYVDEFYLMMQDKTSADYIQEIWKRARKWEGLPCAITQNVEDLLKSEEARTVINNSPFLIILGQTPINRQQLSKMLGISPAEQKYISSAKPGRGLLRIGGEMIPMDDSFPKDTELYKIMSTNPYE